MGATDKLYELAEVVDLGGGCLFTEWERWFILTARRDWPYKGLSDKQRGHVDRIYARYMED